MKPCDGIQTTPSRFPRLPLICFIQYLCILCVYVKWKLTRHTVHNNFILFFYIPLKVTILLQFSILPTGIEYFKKIINKVPSFYRSVSLNHFCDNWIQFGSPPMNDINSYSIFPVDAEASVSVCSIQFVSNKINII